MSAIAATETLSEPILQGNLTTCAHESALESHNQEVLRLKKRWDLFIDRYLLEWGKDPEALEDEGFLPPNPSAIQRAVQIAEAAPMIGLLPPLRVVPDGDGGIAFERKEGVILEVIEIHGDGGLFVIGYQDCRLKYRQQLE